MAWGLDTDTFLNALTRFTRHRGVPREVISERGTNFVGANRNLRARQPYLEKHGDSTHHGAPHFGGAHEVMVKTAKRATHAVVRN